uniref:(northern house mosquito) hypothetical protein n=1 Tax=Culex pipiens TaxID=7175 RepID=A0A8D8FLE8_CULPI
MFTHAATFPVRGRHARTASRRQRPTLVRLVRQLDPVGLDQRHEQRQGHRQWPPQIEHSPPLFDQETHLVEQINRTPYTVSDPSSQAPIVIRSSFRLDTLGCTETVAK